MLESEYYHVGFKAGVVFHDKDGGDRHTYAGESVVRIVVDTRPLALQTIKRAIEIIDKKLSRVPADS